MNKKILIGVVVVSLVAAFFISRGRSEKAVQAMPAVESPRFVAAEGKIEIAPGWEVEIGSEIEGRIEKTFVKEGDFVKQGQVIAIIQNTDIKAKIAESERGLQVSRSRLAELKSGNSIEEIKRARAGYDGSKADYDFARSTYERYVELLAKGFVPKEQVEEKKRIVDVSESRLREAEEQKKLLERGPKAETVKTAEDIVKQTEADVEYFKSLLEKTYIKTPITGKVIRKYLNQGEMVSKQLTIAAVADIDKIRVNAEVDETDIGHVKVGDKVAVTSDSYPNQVFDGVVDEISDYVGVRKIRPNSPAKNLDMKVVQTRIRLEGKTPFKPGMTVDVRITPLKK